MEKIIELPVIESDALPPAIGGPLSKDGNQSPSLRPTMSWHAQFAHLPKDSNAGIINLPPPSNE